MRWKDVSACRDIFKALPCHLRGEAKGYQEHVVRISSSPVEISVGSVYRLDAVWTAEESG
jgi:hypothetical protein